MITKKFLSTLCAITLGLTSIPILTFACSPEVKAETTVSDSEEITGDWDDNITYTLKDGVLTLSGSGELNSNDVIDTESITKVVIEDGITSIGEGAFFGCRSLIEIIIPDSVTSIGGYAFSECNSLIEITIPNSVTSISDGAFCYCSNLREITILNPDCKFNIDDIDDIVPTYTTIIGYANSAAYDYAVNYRKKFVDIETGEILTDLLEESGTWCDNITYTLKDGVLTLSGTGEIEDIEIDHSLALDVIEIVIEDGITSINEGVFEGVFNRFYNLKKVSIPNSLTYIGNGAFSYCLVLKEINIPDSVTYIGLDAFYYCCSLTEITIPSSITEINYYTFFGCSSLTEVTIPKNVTHIYNVAFTCCDNLKEITILNPDCQIDDDHIGYIDTTIIGYAN